MPDRIAVLADIHGVLPALEAVLAEPEVIAADRLVILGDAAAGPHPCGGLDRLLALGDRAAWIRGNADRELVEVRRGTPAADPGSIGAWAAAQLSDRHLDWLSGLPLSLSLPVAGLGGVHFCHATPRRDDEMVLVDSGFDRWAEVFDGLDAEVETVVCGHTHMPFLRLVNGRLVVNPGSIGMPYGRPGAHWALLDRGVHLRRTALDLDAACAATVARSGYPDVAAWADCYVRARVGDREAVETFRPQAAPR
ncbi:MAG: metallophosphoesterase family protein [Inquilinus sp.]|uniref:metallophosphoesterase family protein n=1 Tax=Inquilinus sp. TaxID=1932117 RepID=UPI003F2A893C